MGPACRWNSLNRDVSPSSCCLALQPSAQHLHDPPCHHPRWPAPGLLLQLRHCPLAPAAPSHPELCPEGWLAAVSGPPQCHPLCHLYPHSLPSVRASGPQHPQGWPHSAQSPSVGLCTWTLGWPKKKEGGPLKLLRGSPLPQLCHPNRSPGALPLRLIEQVCPPSLPAVTSQDTVLAFAHKCLGARWAGPHGPCMF